MEPEQSTQFLFLPMALSGVIVQKQTNNLQNAKNKERKERYDCSQKTILTSLGQGLEQSSVGRVLAKNVQDPESDSINSLKRVT